MTLDESIAFVSAELRISPVEVGQIDHDDFIRLLERMEARCQHAEAQEDARFIGLAKALFAAMGGGRWDPKQYFTSLRPEWRRRAKTRAAGGRKRGMTRDDELALERWFESREP